MSRNLGTSKCPNCGYKFTIDDLRGKPIEFRRYSKFTPKMGCRLDCKCGEVYFSYLHYEHTYWSREALLSGDWENKEKYPEFAGKFAAEGFMGPYNTGCFTIDLSYYDSYNDEKGDGDMENPWHLCEDKAEDVEWVWDKGTDHDSDSED